MIDIEKIDLVMEKTGKDYQVVREALLRSGGDVERAIEDIQGKGEGFGASEGRKGSKETTFAHGVRAQDLMDTVKEIWEKGNASTLTIEKEGRVVLNLSLTLGTIGLVLAPVAAIIGLGAALITEYTIKITLKDGEVINVNELTFQKKKKDA